MAAKLLPWRLIPPAYCPWEGALSRTGRRSRTASPQAERRSRGGWPVERRVLARAHAYNKQAGPARCLWLSVHRQDPRHPQDPHHGRVLRRSSGVQQAQGRSAAAFLSGFDTIRPKDDQIRSREASSAVFSAGVPPAVTAHNQQPVMEGCVLPPPLDRFCTARREKMLLRERNPPLTVIKPQRV